jgi:twitching motility two-component system response regulator PilH
MTNVFDKSGDAPSEESSGKVAGTATILIVDDSQTEITVLKRILEQGGYNTEVAENGQVGLEMASNIHPDLILMDVVMPVLNGFQATRKLRKNQDTADIPVIMITTKDQQTDINWGMRQGANEYLVKPVSPATLLAKIKELLNG